MLGVFKANACLNEEEEIALEDWAYGRSVVHTSMKLTTSTRRVDILRQRLREKYDLVQSEIPDQLPPRKTKNLS